MPKSYRLNKRCLLALDAARMRSIYPYMHVSPKGITGTTGDAAIRVSLPEYVGHASDATATGVMPLSVAKALPDDYTITEEELLTGSSVEIAGENYRVPPGMTDIEKASGIDAQPVAELVINAGLLLDVLRTAVKFSDHKRKLTRLRIYKSTLRIDTVPVDGQTFLGAVMGVRNVDASLFPDGSLRPVATGNPETQMHLQLEPADGRKYRDEE